MLALTLLLVALALAAFPHGDKIFATPETCLECHRVFYDDWSQSMHSNALKDPYFIAKLSNEAIAGKFVEEECAKCHTPVAKIQAKLEGREATILRSGFLNTSNEFYEFAIDGVSCTLCHQIKRSAINASYSIDLASKKPYRAIYGPFIPAFGIEMYRSVGYFPTKSQQFLKADFCGNCHVVYTPSVEGEEIIGYFPEQTTFFEWKNSLYNPDKPCQVCHLKPSKAKVSTIPENLFERDFKHHYFSGANSLILRVLGDHDGAKRAEDILKSSAKVKLISVKANDDSIEFVVEIENYAGHKFPTGFPSRRAIVHVVVEDKNGIVFESGKILSDGRVVGEDYPEKHYDFIDSEDKVQIYESVMADKNGIPTIDLLKAMRYIKDNRILPKGFNKSSAHPDTISVGVEDDNFSPGYDRVTYLVKKNYTKPLKIKVELYYQTISSHFFEGLRETNEVNKFREELTGFALTTLVDSDEVVIS